jgi:hypothetical protein
MLRSSRSRHLGRERANDAHSVTATDVELVTVEGIENDRQPADQ